MTSTPPSSGALNSESAVEDAATRSRTQCAHASHDAHSTSLLEPADLPWLPPLSDDENLMTLLAHLDRRLRRKGTRKPLTRAEQACCDVWNFEQDILADGFLHWFDDGDYMNLRAADGRRFVMYLRDALAFAGLVAVANLLADAVSIRRTATAQIEDCECAWDDDGMATVERWERAQLRHLDEAHLALAATTREQLGRFGRTIGGV